MIISYNMFMLKALIAGSTEFFRCFYKEKN